MDLEKHLIESPLWVRTFLVGAISAVVATLINHGIYRLAENQRWLTPLAPVPPGHSKRVAFDYIPVLGWLSLRRESPIHGKFFWVRPMLLELLFVAGMSFLYWHESQGWMITQLPKDAKGVQGLVPHAQFVSQFILISFMLVATFIDFDERSIPDSITIPGTWIGLLLSVFLPMSMPLIVRYDIGNRISLTPIPLSSHARFPPWLIDWPGLSIGCMIFAMWCYSLIPKVMTLRHGVVKGWRYFHASTLRSPYAPKMAIMAVIGLVGIFCVWLRGGYSWQTLESSLFGLAAGGLTMWGVRAAGRIALDQEAMGFGDVTLMCMVGTFLGWQATVLVLPLAAILALFGMLIKVLIGVLSQLWSRGSDGAQTEMDGHLPFGPPLCLATTIIMLNWVFIWDRFQSHLFAESWLMPAVLSICLVLMIVLLKLIRAVRERFFDPLIE